MKDLWLNAALWEKFLLVGTGLVLLDILRVYTGILLNSLRTLYQIFKWEKGLRKVKRWVKSPT